MSQRFRHFDIGQQVRLVGGYRWGTVVPFIPDPSQGVAQLRATHIRVQLDTSHDHAMEGEQFQYWPLDRIVGDGTEPQLSELNQLDDPENDLSDEPVTLEDDVPIDDSREELPNE